MYNMPTQNQARGGRKLYAHDYRNWTSNECLVQLRKRELLAYHHICGTFRAQGHLTPDKLKLLKDVASALYITEARHRDECRMAVNDEELTAIATSVAGPNSDIEWRREGRSMMPHQQGRRINTASIELLDYIAQAAKEALKELKNSDESVKTVTKTLNINRNSLQFDHDYMKEQAPEINSESETDEEANYEELSSSVSSTTELIEESPSEGDVKPEKIAVKADPDTALMPPPPPLTPAPKMQLAGLSTSSTPVSSISSMTSATGMTESSSPTSQIPSLSSVITVPPASSFITIPSSSSATLTPSLGSVITVPALPSVITVPLAPSTSASGITLSPVKSEPQEALLTEKEEMEIVSFDDPLPPLVVVPPPDSQPPTLSLSSNVSIKVNDSGEVKKRKRKSSEGSSVSATKTKGVNSVSQMSSPSTVTGTVAKKVAPTINRPKSQGPPPKVIIVSSPSSGNLTTLSRSVATSLGNLPVFRTTTPRLQTSVAQSGVAGSKPRPRMLTVAARGRGRNMGTTPARPIIKQDNVQVSAENTKNLSSGYQQAKIIKPQSMFLVNTGKGSLKSSTTSPGQAMMVSRRNLSEGGSGAGGGNKQSVVILHKGSGNRTVALTNTSKDLMQKLMSKKCVVIQSAPKGHIKGASSKEHTFSSTPGKQQGQNMVVLDLNQEQYRHSLPNTTLNEIVLQACSTEATPTTSMCTLSRDPDIGSGLISEEEVKSLPLEEVSLSIGQSESIVTLGEAVDLLGGDGPVQAELSSPMVQPLPAVTTEPVPPPLVPMQADNELDPMDPARQILDITPEELAASEISFMPIKKHVPDEPENMKHEEIETETISSEVELECEEQTGENNVEVQEIVFQNEDENVIEDLDDVGLFITEEDENELVDENKSLQTETATENRPEELNQDMDV